MKKSAVLIMIALVLLSSVSAFAAVKSTKYAYSDGGVKFGIGTVVLPSTFGNFVGLIKSDIYGTIAINFSKVFAADFGFNFMNGSGDGRQFDSIMSMLIKGNYVIADPIHVGALLNYSSRSAPNANLSGFGLGGYFGVSKDITDNFIVTADIIPIMFNSVSLPNSVSATVLNFFGGMISAKYMF